MTIRARLPVGLLRDELNFLLTNRIPRHLANRVFAWFSRIENPHLARLSIAVWQRFADLDLSEAAARQFNSVHECFTRRLKPDARPIDPDPTVLVSPCDALVGACGLINRDLLIQAKGFSYRLDELLHDRELAALYLDGHYATLRLTSSMYHRFHAPHDCRIERVLHISGDTWNVNPIALRRIEKLFCKNERAVLPAILPQAGLVITLVPVAAILVGGIRLNFLDPAPNPMRRGAAEFRCRATFRKGEEMGWFEHGSTILVLAPRGVTLCDSVQPGALIRMGNPLMRLP